MKKSDWIWPALPVVTVAACFIFTLLYFGVDFAPKMLGWIFAFAATIWFAGVVHRTFTEEVQELKEERERLREEIRTRLRERTFAVSRRTRFEREQK